MSNKQLQYNQAIDNLSYLVLNYPKPVRELLARYNIVFQGKPTKAQLGYEVIELLKAGHTAFEKALEQLIQRFSAQEQDPFWGAIAKGAAGVIGGLFKKKKRQRSSSSNAAAVQAAAAKRDMAMRIQRLREAQERRRREAEERRRREEERRQREAEARQRAEAEKRKTNMLLMIGGGVVVLGLGAVVLMKSGRPAMPYGQPPMQIPR